jgi:hypothetical protein
MIKRHSSVGRDFSDEQVLWKYYSLEHFLWLIQNKALYFGRADRYEDKREILATNLHAKLFYYNDLESLQRDVERDKPHIFLNCWTMSEHESILMWKAYSNINNGVVIKTNANRLMASYSGDASITIGKVKYIDEETQSAQPFGQELNWLNLVFSKLWFYSDEKELRLYFDDRVQRLQHKVPVDLNILIDEIRLSPKVDPNSRQIIYDTLSSEGIDLKVRQSDIEIE